MKIGRKKSASVSGDLVPGVTGPFSVSISGPIGSGPYGNLAAKFTNMRHTMLYGFSLAGENGYTDEQAAKAARVNLRSCYWKRAGELRQFGYVEPVKVSDGPRKGQHEHRKSDLGGMQGVWRITKAGRAQLEMWGR